MCKLELFKLRFLPTYYMNQLIAMTILGAQKALRAHVLVVKTEHLRPLVIPAKAGIHCPEASGILWIPAFAGMTAKGIICQISSTRYRG